MPQNFKGQPTPEQLRDPRLQIYANEEGRLLGLAAQRGIEETNIGAFFVIMVADLPCIVSDEEYQIFEVSELVDQAEVEKTWFYDEEKNRLVGTIPPTRKIIEALQNSR